MAKIEVHNLYKIFGPRPQEVLPQVQAEVPKDEIWAKTGHTVGLDNISLSVEQGETFVVMGLSGSGKSTFVRCVNRLIEATAGEILIDDSQVLELSDREIKQLRREKLGMVFQRFALFPHRSVIRNVAYGLRVQGVAREERLQRAQHWIDVVGLSGYEQVRPRQLSGGMQQRVGLARALCTDPEVLLMDEAFSALDPLIRREMQDELIRLQRELHKTIIFITHDLDEALRLGDRIAILKDGRLVQIGTPIEIITRPADYYVEAFVRDVNRARVLTARVVMDREITPIPVSTPPQEALRGMRRLNHYLSYVVDRDRKYLGVVLAEQVAAAKVGDPNLAGTLIADTPTTTPDKVLTDLLAVSAASTLPIAVVDEQGVFLGALPKSTILRALASEHEILRALTSEEEGEELHSAKAAAWEAGAGEDWDWD